MLITLLIHIQFLIIFAFIFAFFYYHKSYLMNNDMIYTKIIIGVIICVMLYLAYVYFRSSLFRHKLNIDLDCTFIGANNNHINLLSYL